MWLELVSWVYLGMNGCYGNRWAPLTHPWGTHSEQPLALPIVKAHGDINRHCCPSHRNPSWKAQMWDVFYAGEGGQGMDSRVRIDPSGWGAQFPRSCGAFPSENQRQESLWGRHLGMRALDSGCEEVGSEPNRGPCCAEFTAWALVDSGFWRKANLSLSLKKIFFFFLTLQ